LRRWLHGNKKMNALSLPPFVSTFKDRHGVIRPRFRRAGYSRYLPLDLESREFAAAYDECIKTAPHVPARSPRSPVGQARAMLARRNWDQSGEFVYFIQVRGMVKIGFSSMIVNRMSKLASSSPTRVQLLAIMLGGRSVERKIHETLAADRIKGEWFRRSEDVKRMIAFARNGGTFVNIV
jgi:hypothetical protein